MNDRVILLVEDNPDDEALTRRALTKNNILNELVVATDGAMALDYLFGTGTFATRNTDESPSLVLLDLNLPKIDGIEVLRRMRADERTKQIPVVMLTTSKQDEDIAMSYSHGANSYVCKPVDFTEFVEAARQIGLYWLMINRQAPKRGG
ncbi:response regulator [Pseudophaeobacter arcticus]|jgi:two-component system response regulator|uniref:response regulator n=1 Tax=Pseudophaeobacter arcticus TaxID=385492 RepID=UPI0039E622D7